MPRCDAWKHRANGGLSRLSYSSGMVKVTDIGGLEGRMCGHLAASLCAFFAGPGCDGAGQKGGFIARTCPSDWVAAEQALLDVGVMHVEPVGADDAVTRAVFSMNAAEMPDFLAASIGDGDPRIVQIVQSFVAIACGGYSRDVLSDQRDWFEPPPGYATAMKWLARHGYAEREQHAFRWTDRIGPAMRASQIWNDQDRSVEASERIERDAECELIWSTMPDTLKRGVKSGRVSFFDLVKALALGWRDGRWRAHRGDEPFELSGQTLLARRIFELAGRSE
ncbi:hypothetical protein ACVIIZ_005617 [Bradyrhizobium sp. USDA 4523]|uniref:hypothetical protein n=1 Tax=unclassified Bradyrhizobium TaxID=2631580 RepID=UPI00209F9D78|nr:MULTISPECIES: hypothetical protein [unclassified Bradyrhizobium]MCP1839322.1 hypothetical protein [Bradyrhizobium sp. USDA 4538]